MKDEKTWEEMKYCKIPKMKGIVDDQIDGWFKDLEIESHFEDDGLRSLDTRLVEIRKDELKADLKQRIRERIDEIRKDQKVLIFKQEEKDAMCEYIESQLLGDSE